MNSPCTAPRIVRCRVRDLASCFYACRLPLEDDQPDILCSNPPEMSRESIVFDFEGSSRGKKSSRKMSSTIELMGRESSEPRFAEEEYIVFCFREDGAIDMINNDAKSSEQKDEHINIVALKCAEKGREKRDDEIKEMMKPVSLEHQNSSNVDSYESCDSNLSDTSASSFAFPVLGIEWIGSPVHMPREGKQDDRSVCLHCCRF